jgi:hypothetical protein
MIRCPKCGRRQPASVISCDCGYDLQPYRRQLQTAALAYHAAARPYRWLPIFQILLRLMGAVCLAGGAVGAILLLADKVDFWQVVLALVAASIIAVPYFASAEVITVLLTVSAQQPNLQQLLQRIEQALQQTDA